MDLLITKKTLDIFAKALLLFAGLQMIFVLALATGFMIEKESILDQGANILSSLNHRHLAWTGLFLTLIGFPLAYALGWFVTKKHTPALYFLEGSWRECITGFFAGIIFLLLFFILLTLTGHARFVAFPERLTPQELVASILAYSLIMLLIAFNNELVYRGILMSEWSLLWKNRPAAVWTGSLIYGTMRAWSSQGTINQRLILFVTGIIFSWFMTGIMVYKKSMKHAIGVHAGYYFCFSALLGNASAGSRLNTTPFIVEIHGSSTLFGGILGIENSLVFNMVLLVITVILWYKIDTKTVNYSVDTNTFTP